MVIDTSALLAILLREPEAEAFAAAIEGDPKRLVSAATALEAAIVILAKKGPPGGRELDLLLERAQVEIIAFHQGQLEIARGAWQRFGKATIRRASTLVTVSPTPFPKPRANLCFSKEGIFRRLMC